MTEPAQGDPMATGPARSPAAEADGAPAGTGRTIGQLIWRRFRKNRIGMVGGVVVGLFLLTAVFASFLANMSIREQSAAHVLAPPQRVHLFDDGRPSRPFIYNLDKHRDRETLALSYTEDTSRKYYLRFFVRGFSYRFLWLIPSDLHLFGVEEGGRLSLLGTDTLGRDLYSRLLIGGQVSLSVPFVGVGLSMLIGTILGVVSGYFGGRVDHYIQRSIEILLSFPSLPLWMALAAAMPVTMAVDHPLRADRGDPVADRLGRAGQGGARQGAPVPGRGLRGRRAHVGRRPGAHHLPPPDSGYAEPSDRERYSGHSGHDPWPESSLSFLGVGITPPLTSWGLLLGDAQKIEVLVNHQWLMIPGLLITVIVLAFNFFGDGLRDAADPYA